MRLSPSLRFMVVVRGKVAVRRAPKKNYFGKRENRKIGQYQNNIFFLLPFGFYFSPYFILFLCPTYFLSLGRSHFFFLTLSFLQPTTGQACARLSEIFYPIETF